MKKVIYSIFSVSILLFSACTEDRGTTTEVADANRNESVNQSHIRGYGQEGVARTTSSDAAYQNHSQQISAQMATDLQLEEDKQQRVAAIIYDRERRLGELESRYNFSESNRMGGQASNDTEADMSDNTNITADPMRSNNTGNVNEGNVSLESNTGRDMATTNTTMTSERNSIMADADKELKAVLTPEQYNLFVKNRDKYEEVKYKNDATDTKIKSEGDEMKYKSGDHKVKVEGKETKIKSENEKLKVERK